MAQRGPPAQPLALGSAKAERLEADTRSSHLPTGPHLCSRSWPSCCHSPSGQEAFTSRFRRPRLEDKPTWLRNRPMPGLKCESCQSRRVAAGLTRLCWRNPTNGGATQCSLAGDWPGASFRRVLASLLLRPGRDRVQDLPAGGQAGARASGRPPARDFCPRRWQIRKTCRVT